ncbi:hypothetical protein JG687_00012621 [Phytophthora cactorum]|uniref:Uncharacterized protein n=1 Tax=Phytophthora cactorum TaxID=29920 RepID=A0A8T1U3S9_9STRA|nr:hypothetical protein JG687_00012621 [Phytophthora cactorum]
MAAVASVNTRQQSTPGQQQRVTTLPVLVHSHPAAAASATTPLLRSLCRPTLSCTAGTAMATDQRQP